jgi:hypothetical protein
MILLLAIALAAALPQEDARKLVERLDADRIEDRDKAERDLEALGKDAVPELRRVEATATGEHAIRLKRALRRALLSDPLEEKLIVTVDPSKYPGRVIFSADGHVAYTIGNRVALDGIPGEAFDSVDRFEFAPDGRTLAVVARRDGNGYAVVGRRTFGPYGALGPAHTLAAFPIVFSADGRRFAFRVREEELRYMVVDGKQQGPYADVDHPVFSPDGVHVAYAANQGGEHRTRFYTVTGGKWFVVVDGKLGEEFDSVGLTTDEVFPTASPVFSPDSRRMAYAAKENKRQFVVVDGKKQAEADSILGLRFSPDSRHLAYTATTNDRSTVVFDGRPQGDFDATGFDTAFSPDGSRFAFSASTGPKKWAIVVNGVKGDDYEMAGTPCFSADGERLAFIGRTGQKRFIVVDGTPGPEFDFVGTPTFDPDGKDVSYVARNTGKYVVVHDGLPGEIFDLILTEESFFPVPLTRSPKSSALLYRAKQGEEWFVVMGDRKIGPFDYVWRPRFSADGRKAMFGARKGGELWWKVVDAAQ